MAVWQHSRLHDDPFMSPFPETPQSIAYNWATQFARPSRFSGMRFSPFRIGILLLTIGGFVLVRDLVTGSLFEKVSPQVAS
jgi:hypothetical protein